MLVLYCISGVILRCLFGLDLIEVEFDLIEVLFCL